MTQQNSLNFIRGGSTDWTGGVAPAGGTHTGSCTITMTDATQFVVAHNKAEVQRKRDQHAGPPTIPAWCGFDQLATAVPVVLDLNLIRSVQ